MITEHERRQLHEIEMHLRMDDPRFAARLSPVRGERLRLRLRAGRTPLSCMGALAGMALTVAFFATVPVVALVGVGLLGTAAGTNATRMAAALHRGATRMLRRVHRASPPSTAPTL